VGRKEGIACDAVVLLESIAQWVWALSIGNICTAGPSPLA
jgi:hypothetical protein